MNDIPESFADIGELPWPIAGDYLLSEDSDWWMVACLDWSSDAWSTYANGYRKAAGLIVEHITASQTDQDFLVWPFALCWRHYVELRLKRLNILLTELLQKAPPNKKHTHSIRKLWSEFRRLTEETEYGPSSAELDNVENVFKAVRLFGPEFGGVQIPSVEFGRTQPSGASATFQAVP